MKIKTCELHFHSPLLCSSPADKEPSSPLGIPALSIVASTASSVALILLLVVLFVLVQPKLKSFHHSRWETHTQMNLPGDLFQNVLMYCTDAWWRFLCPFEDLDIKILHISPLNGALYKSTQVHCLRKYLDRDMTGWLLLWLVLMAPILKLFMWKCQPPQITNI